MAEMKQIVSLSLAGEKYGINIMDIEEIIRMMEITRVPKAPPFVEGIINLRGQVIPIVDLRNKLGLPVPEEDHNTRIINVGISGRKLGFVVDKVDEVLRLDPGVVDKAPAVSMNVDSNYIEGVARTENGMIIILEVHNIFSTRESNQLNAF
ncbi:chemotaxis protein CheW [Limisalsivibrio acetivorans]|uniref:chemotaxis protein CheW n=1 Tax=Limisalsivibrio acetivorans TaxID=1304888 RepID=UPI0003B45789|nr:chemotaxis protein CheW [Limisalsivibrio acetivorans]